MKMEKKIGVVIEGGGFRGIYTGGVLDYFLEQEWHFPYVLGVSMGACNGGNYISKQVGRSVDIPYRFMEDPRYISYRNMLTKGSLFGMDFIFHEIPYKHYPYDFEKARESGQKFIVGAMNVEKGTSDFFDMDELTNDEMLLALKASCSLPIISKMVTLKDKQYLDGGLTDSIPVKKAFEDGMDKVIVLLTRERGYRKKPSRSKLIDVLYKKYPKVIESINNRHQRYNEEIEWIEQLEKEGKVLPIYPKEPIAMGRTERDKEKLMKCYHEGYLRGEELHARITSFISE